MNQKIIGYLIACCAVMLGLVVAVAAFGGGLDKRTVALAEAEIRNVADAKKTVNSEQATVSSWIKSDPDLFAAQAGADGWDASFKKANDELKATDATVEKIQSLISANDSETEAELVTLTETLAASRAKAVSEISSIRFAAQDLIDFKKEIDKKLPAMNANYTSILSFDIAALESQVSQAATDWPEKQDDLTNRVNSFKQLKENVQASWQSTEEARNRVSQNKFTGNDVETLVRAADSFEQAKASLQGAPARLSALIDQLYWSWDKTLVDFEINEGQTVTFREKTETTRVRALVPEGKVAETKKSEQWRSISENEYKKKKDSLGMVVEHKPAGKYDNESERITQPPGYSYVAPPGRRNRYGYWGPRNGGGSFWHFYGQYAFMSHMFGGPRYYVTPTMYTDYWQHRGTGRTYYGRDNVGRKMYGSDGTATRQRFSSSKYVQTNGFKNSQYVQSGGKYRGSRYQRNTSSTRSSNRYTSSSRSSSSRSSFRNSSSRSSGFRSSSRSFGGK